MDNGEVTGVASGTATITRSDYVYLWTDPDEVLPDDYYDLDTVDPSGMQLVNRITTWNVQVKKTTVTPIIPTPEEIVPELHKTATDLVNDQTTVTLNIGGSESKTASYVVFVLDKSASVDVRNEAMAMLTELMGQAVNNDIYVAVVNFGGTAEIKCDRTLLNAASLETIETAILNSWASSGTNIAAGLSLGKELLDADGTVKAEAKHLVLVTDGLPRMWSYNASDPQVVYQEDYGSTMWADMEMYSSFHSSDEIAQITEEIKDVPAWMEAHGGIYLQEMADYAQDYYGTNVNSKNPDYSNITRYIPYETFQSGQLNGLGHTIDLSWYATAELYGAAAEAGYHCYAFCSDVYAYLGSYYLIGYNFICNLDSLAGVSTGYTAGSAEVDGMFDQVKSSILYLIQNGTVTDVIGNDFDLTDAENVTEDTFGLQVGADVFPAVILDRSADNKTVEIGFGTPDATGIYPYVVTYSAGDPDIGQEEQFVWAINVPVEAASPLSLSYGLTLVNKATEPGTYRTPTNESAELKYTSTDDNRQKKEVFEKPYVNYEVEDVKPPVPTSYDLVVRYLEEGTETVLSDPYTTSLKEGTDYDVTVRTQLEIEGYTIAQVTGDSVTGVMDGNKEIIVWYTEDDAPVVTPPEDDTPTTIPGDDDEPSTDLPDEDTPTTDLPEEETPTADLPEEETPTTEQPVEETPVELPEEDVPMAEAPETGDASLLWLAAAALSGSGLAWLALSERKRREQE